MAIIIKPNPDENFYVWWSSIVDNAVEYGPRNNSESTDRFERADREGTSSFLGDPGDRLYGWNDETIILRNEPSLNEDTGYWTLPRKHLKEFCLRDEGADMRDLATFHPYED